MNNDISAQNQTPSVSPSLPSQDVQPGDTPFETSSFDQEQELTSQTDPVHPVFSLQNLRSDLPDPHDRFEAIRGWLAVQIAECVWEDRRAGALAMLDELVLISGFVSKDTPSGVTRTQPPYMMPTM